VALSHCRAGVPCGAEPATGSILLHMFHNVSKPYEQQKAYRCPCCGRKTLHGRGQDEICQVCFWEDDGQDDHDAEEVRGGPNGALSLKQARINYRACGASDPKFVSKVRLPLAEEQ
jgi:Cysteine-rich CPCC